MEEILLQKQPGKTQVTVDLALQKLVNVMGAERARQLTEQTLLQLGLRELKTAHDRLRFGNALIARGGVLESIGRAIKIQAILHGAPDD